MEQNVEKVNQLESELKEALAKIKDLENNKDEKSSEKKVRFGDFNKKDDGLKAKQMELDKLKLIFNKVCTPFDLSNKFLIIGYYFQIYFFTRLKKKM